MRYLTALLIGLMASPLHACPFCGSATSDQVRASIFNDQFWSNVGLVATPFPLMLLGVVLVHRLALREPPR